MPTFLSQSRNARVTFPPEQFGMGEGVEQFLTKDGDWQKKKLPHKAAKFEFGRLVEQNAKRVKMLRDHPGNRANGGDVYWEQPERDTAGLAILGGKITAILPEGGLTKEDIEVLETLAGASRSLAPRALDSVRKKTIWLHERLKMAGILPPPVDFNIARMKARLVEMLGAIEDQGIWKGKHDKNGADS